MCHSFIKVNQGHIPYIYLFGVLCVYEIKIHDIDNLRLRKCLVQSWFDFDLRLTSGVTV